MRVKIGHTTDVARRLATLQTGSPVALSLHAQACVANPRLLESQLHARLRLRRLHGEWFELPADELAIACAEYGLHDQ
jgi:hypothetical protein